MSKIVRVSEGAALGLHALMLLAQRQGEPVSVADLAQRLQGSSHHLSKVLQRLARSGFVRALRGPAGGYVLGRPAAAVTLLDIYEAIDGPLRSGGCLFELPMCDGHSCLFGSVMARVTEELRTSLAGTSLANLDMAAETAPATAGKAVSPSGPV